MTICSFRPQDAPEFYTLPTPYRKRRGTKKPFIIEARAKDANGGFGWLQNWEKWARYASFRQAQNALKNLNNGRKWMEYRHRL